MNVVFIDDEPASIEPAIDVLTNNNFKCQCLSFENFNSFELASRLDVVVLDMMNGAVGDDSSGAGGKSIFEKIWS